MAEPSFREYAETCLDMMRLGWVERVVPEFPGLDVSKSGRGAVSSDPRVLWTWRVWRYAARRIGWIGEDLEPRFLNVTYKGRAFGPNDVFPDRLRFFPAYGTDMDARCYRGDAFTVNVLRPAFFSCYEFRRNRTPFLDMLDLVHDHYNGRSYLGADEFQEIADAMDFDDWMEFWHLVRTSNSWHLERTARTTDILFPEIEEWRRMSEDPACDLFAGRTGEDRGKAG